MYQFNIPNDKEPTQEEIIQGFIHHTATLLGLYGAGKHLVAYVRQFENEPLTKESVLKIMGFCCSQIDKLKSTLDNIPKISLEVE